MGVIMERPVGKPTLEIRSVQLAKEDPGSEFLEKLPVIDEFGQWSVADWPGKIKDLEQLKKQWTEEEEKLQGGDYDYCQRGGYKNTKAEATGFFRVEQIDGRWWFVDPDGHLFLSMGVNGMGNWNGTPTAGRENYYAAMPPADLAVRADDQAGTAGFPAARGVFLYLEFISAFWPGMAAKMAGSDSASHGRLGPEHYRELV